MSCSNVEQIQYKNLQFEVWDLGGQANLRPSWATYYKSTDALIMLVDSTDRARIGIAKVQIPHSLPLKTSTLSPCLCSAQSILKQLLTFKHKISNALIKGKLCTYTAQILLELYLLHFCAEAGVPPTFPPKQLVGMQFVSARTIYSPPRIHLRFCSRNCSRSWVMKTSSARACSSLPTSKISRMPSQWKS